MIYHMNESGFVIIPQRSKSILISDKDSKTSDVR